MHQHIYGMNYSLVLLVFVMGFFYAQNQSSDKEKTYKTPTISFDLTYDVLRFVVVVVVVVALLKVLLSIQALRRYAFAIT